jgi:DNA repair protein RadA
MKKKEILDEIEKDILENKRDGVIEPEKVDILENKTTADIIIPGELTSRYESDEIKSEDNKKFVDEETGEILEDTVPAEVEIKKDDNEERKLITIAEIKGVGTTTVKKLQEIGIDNIADLAIANASSIHEKLASSKHSRAFCEELVVYADKYLYESGILDKPLRSCKEMKNQPPRERFSTGDEKIDEWFGGGIESKSVTEFYGRFKSGKTQICYSTAVCTAASGKKVMYVDTENTFDPMRVEEICKVKGYDVDTVEENILVMQPQAAALLTKNMQLLGKHIKENNIKLVIVDSIIALHRAEFHGRGTLADRQQKLGEIISFLVKGARNYDVGVMITNQVLDSPDPFNPGVKPTGGNIIGHGSTHRIYMKSQGQSNAASNTNNLSTMLMEDSPNYARSELTIQLGKFGVRWVDPSKPIPKA